MGVEVVKRNVETQSVYRESEAQTEAYSPQYHCSQKDVPEILLIKDIITSKRLPLTETEIVAIEKLRQKRLLESKLPPTTDEMSLHIRERIVDANAFEEWRKREEIIQKLQEKKFLLIKDALRRREKAKEELSGEKIERIRQSFLEKRDNLDDISQINRIKKIQIINKTFSNLETALNKNDKSIISLYSDYSSKIYAPKARDGFIVSNIDDINQIELQTYPNLVALEKHIPLHIKRPILPDKEPNIYKESTAKKRIYKQHGEALERLYLTLSTIDTMSSIQDETASEKPDKVSGIKSGANTINESLSGLLSQTLSKTKKNSEKQTTINTSANIINSTINEELADATKSVEEIIEFENKNKAILLLQKLVRGRGIQNLMSEGRETRRDLINELRIGDIFNPNTDHNITSIFDGYKINSGDKKLLSREELNEQNEAILKEEEMSNTICALIEFAEAETISETLNDLNRELRRYQEERRVSAMMLFAERERRLRQCKESGRRQIEETTRNKQDLLFNEIMNVEHTTVESYIENIFIDCVQLNAEKSVLEELKLRSKYINNVIDDIENKYVNPESTIQDLFSSFLYPHIQRETVRRQVESSQQKFVLSAQKVMNANIDIIKNSFNNKQQNNEHDDNNSENHSENNSQTSNENHERNNEHYHEHNQDINNNIINSDKDDEKSNEQHEEVFQTHPMFNSIMHIG